MSIAFMTERKLSSSGSETVRSSGALAGLWRDVLLRAKGYLYAKHSRNASSSRSASQGSEARYLTTHTPFFSSICARKVGRLVTKALIACFSSRTSSAGKVYQPFLTGASLNSTIFRAAGGGHSGLSTGVRPEVRHQSHIAMNLNCRKISLRFSDRQTCIADWYLPAPCLSLYFSVRTTHYK